MNLKRNSLLACLILLSPIMAAADDKLVAVDASNDLITVNQRGTLRSFKVKKFTEVTLNGLKAKTTELRPGMMVTLVLSDSQSVAKLAARGNPADGAVKQSPPKAPAVGDSPAGAARRLTIKLQVDGSDVIKIGSGRLWIEHSSAKRPTEIAVNGIQWEPEWKGETSEVFTGFPGGLAPFANGKINVKQLKGRGETTVIEPPTAENNQTLSFRIQDGGRGADEHEVRITW